MRWVRCTSLAELAAAKEPGFGSSEGFGPRDLEDGHPQTPWFLEGCSSRSSRAAS